MSLSINASLLFEEITKLKLQLASVSSENEELKKLNCASLNENNALVRKITEKEAEVKNLKHL